MDRRERLNDPTTAVSMAAHAVQAKMWTAVPGIIQSFDPDAMTCEVQPAIQGVQIDPKTGNVSNVDLPLLVDCPVQFAAGGGVTMTFPITEGDECLVVFSSRCIDAWHQNGGVQPQMTYRMHDLSDGYVIPGIRSKPRVLSGISTSTAQLRSDDGETYVELDPTAQKVRIVAPGGIDLIGPINLGDEGGQPVARVGDTVSGGVITTGSSEVKAA